MGRRAAARRGAALTVLISKVRAAVGRGRPARAADELSVVLPEPALVDVEQALAAVHAAESAVAVGRLAARLVRWR